MTDENKQRMQEEYAEAALELLMNEYAEIEGAALWREYQAAEAARNSPETPSREDRKGSRGSGKRNRRPDFLMCFGNVSKRVAAIFLILLVLLSPMAMSVDAFKLPVLNYIVAIEKKFSGFNFGKNEDLQNEQEVLIDVIKAVPCPIGYRFSHHEVASDGRIWIYFTCNEKMAMRLSFFPTEGQVNIDTEDVEQIPLEIHGYETVYLQKEGHRLMWMDAERELIFSLHAFELNKNDFWRYVYTLTEKLSQ